MNKPKIALKQFFEARERKNSCRWCSKSATGEYTMSVFTDPATPARKITLSFYDRKARVRLDIGGDLDGATLEMPISYCPMCGRRISKRSVDE